VVSGLTFSDALPGTMGVLAANLDLRALNDTVNLGLRGAYAKGAEAEEMSADLTLDIKLN
jgi:hypothetical protein